jgi:hypothetical protein
MAYNSLQSPGTWVMLARKVQHSFLPHQGPDRESKGDIDEQHRGIAGEDREASDHSKPKVARTRDYLTRVRWKSDDSYGTSRALRRPGCEFDVARVPPRFAGARAGRAQVGAAGL